ncbi:transglycosylase SLT domain-containing protein [Francisella sp. 19X1-34]|uniref:transglycosylase SLT domain-containing protein n=1 Tax=Francisella sp. 19X1-34 TaxID=3087177 RepID=UPI002E332188|nr:transglycosylase SLT domain-containing protein [Francisella sp. 19X1-34]MED7788744.1 transglycosylase SLT domain-containing protein [Francisella sp. 19X1-34]
MQIKINFKYILLILFVIIISSCSEETKIDDKMGPCEILAQHPSWKKPLKMAQDKYKLPPAFAMAIIYQESRFDANAKSKYSSAYGYAQAVDGTWKHFQQDVNSNAKRNNFNDSVQFIGWYMAQLSKSLKISMSDSKNLYMAYMLGATGFKRYKAGTFKNKAKIQEDKKIAEKVSNYTKAYQSQFKNCKI